MANKAFGARLRRLRDRTILRQEDAAQELGVARSTYAKYETGESEPDHRMVAKIAALYGVTTDHLMGYQAAEPELEGLGISHFVRLPVLGSIRAGQPIEMLRETGEYENVEFDLVGNKDAFILRVTGDSMIGDNIHQGDRVVVLYTPDFAPSDICVVAINGKDATLKRVKCQGDVCVLTPSNPTLEPMVYPLSEIHVIGIVVEVRHRLKR